MATAQGTVALRVVREKLPLFVLAAASSVVTFVVQQRGGSVDASTTGLGQRVANALVSYVAYIGKMLWPAHLAAYYPYDPSLPPRSVLGCVLVLVGISMLAIWKVTDYPYLLTGWLWYLGTLVPAIGLVQVGTQAMADRYTYVPMIGLSIIVAWGTSDLLGRWQKCWLAPPATLLVMLACALSARAQVETWSSSTALWEHALAVTTNNYAAHAFLGNALTRQGRLDEAIQHYTEALRIRPDYPEAHNNLGPALAGQGNLEEAIAHFSEAVRLRPGYADAHSNLGVALAMQGKLDEAIAHFSEAVRLDPDHPNAHYGLALALRNKGRVEEAIHEFHEALRIQPDHVDAQRGLDALRRGGG